MRQQPATKEARRTVKRMHPCQQPVLDALAATTVLSVRRKTGYPHSARHGSMIEFCYRYMLDSCVCTHLCDAELQSMATLMCSGWAAHNADRCWNCKLPRLLDR